MKLITLTFALFLIYTQTFAQISVGEPATDFTLQVLNSQETVTLSDLSDKVVYIFFYGAGCPHCRTNGPVTETEIFQTFKDEDNFVAFGLDTWNQSASANVSFESSTGITYPLLLNARDVLVEYYGSSAFYDRSIVIGAENVLRYKGTSFVNNDFTAVNEVIQTELDQLATSSEFDVDTPTEISLDQNYPNPFNPGTNISFTLNEAADVSLTVYNLIGQPVATLADGALGSGSHTVRWDASAFPSGIYLYRLETTELTLTKRMLLIK